MTPGENFVLTTWPVVPNAAYYQIILIQPTGQRVTVSRSPDLAAGGQFSYQFGGLLPKTMYGFELKMIDENGIEYDRGKTSVVTLSVPTTQAPTTQAVTTVEVEPSQATPTQNGKYKIFV